MSTEKLSEEQLNQLEDKVNSLKEEKIRAEEKLKNFRKQKDEIIAELATFGIVPKDLNNKISELEEKIRAKLAEIAAQIPEKV